MESFKKWFCLLHLLLKLGFSTGMNISLHIAFCTCNNNSSKKSANIVFSVTGPGCYVSCYYCGLTLYNLKGSYCIYTKHFEYSPDCIHLLQNAPKFVIDNKLFYRSTVSFKKCFCFAPTIGEHAVLYLSSLHTCFVLKRGQG